MHVYIVGDGSQGLTPVFLDDVKLIAVIAGTCPAEAPVLTSCADANTCDGAEVCDGAGHCLKGIPPEIDDQNACTADSCEPALGVVHEPLPSGLSCTYGPDCGGVGRCDGAGTCQATSATPGELRIYSDEVEACFMDESHGLYDVAQTTNVHDGSRAITFVPNAGDGLYFRREGMSGQYDAVEFWVNGGVNHAQAVSVWVYSDGTPIASQDIGPWIVPGVYGEDHGSPGLDSAHGTLRALDRLEHGGEPGTPPCRWDPTCLRDRSALRGASAPGKLLFGRKRVQRGGGLRRVRGVPRGKLRRRSSMAIAAPTTPAIRTWACSTWPRRWGVRARTRTPAMGPRHATGPEAAPQGRRRPWTTVTPARSTAVIPPPALSTRPHRQGPRARTRTSAMAPKPATAPGRAPP